MAEFQYKVPGEYMYGGVRLMEINPVSSLDAIKQFEFRDDDVFLGTYPKSGNARTRESFHHQMNTNWKCICAFSINSICTETIFIRIDTDTSILMEVKAW